MRIIARMFLVTLMIATFFSNSVAMAGSPNCNPHFVNPFSDVEFNCMFPIRMMGMTMVGGNSEGTPGKISNPLCSCKEGDYNRVGITMGFREPARLMDVVIPQFCLNGLGIDLGNSSVWGDGSSRSEVIGGSIFANVHYYTYLPFFILQIMLDFGCLEKLPLDVAYLSEFDPIHDNEALGLMMFPETLLFAVTPLILACVADAISSSVYSSPIDALFWCSGGWGTTYPLSGYAHVRENNIVEAAALIGTKFLARAHRTLIAWGSSGEAAMCGMYPMPVIRKTQYKYQLTSPVRSRECLPIGKSGLLWSTNKNPPVPGLDGNFTYMIWRWKDCCAF